MTAKETFKKACDAGLIEKVSGVYVANLEGGVTQTLGASQTEALEMLGEIGIIQLEAKLIEKANLDAEVAKASDQAPPDTSDPPPVQKSNEPAEEVVVGVDRYRFRNQQMSGGITGIVVGSPYIGSRMVTLTWDDKGVTEPDVTEEEYPILAAILKKSGASDISLLAVKPYVEPTKDVPKRYTFLHPDGPETSGTLHILGNAVPVKEGFVETTDYSVAEYLRAKKYELIKEEVVEEA